ncbi:hypothetical protein EVAR_15810_1 [Eumeta japonica]|uniref:Uncharacterized protein n=1 Tax=Eumeta variegata TaxID=151549 RepID=A0A4C1TZP8_EUMVA|nr:hypothetical protein EVAR_15810_1 [Eumeta japonica]
MALLHTVHSVKCNDFAVTYAAAAMNAGLTSDSSNSSKCWAVRLMRQNVTTEERLTFFVSDSTATKLHERAQRSIVALSVWVDTSEKTPVRVASGRCLR